MFQADVPQEDITEKKIYLATIEPRGVTMGHVFSVHKQDVYSIHNDQLIANIDIGFGGRAAEEVLYKGVSSWEASAVPFFNCLIKFIE